MVAIAVIVALTLNGRSGGGSAKSATPGKSAASVALKPTVSSFDPAGGSGFRPDGRSWHTQTYTSPQFGNLKSGVGLLLDLGAPHEVSTVGFTVADGPLTVELRSGDQQSSELSGYAKVGSSTSATGATTLRASSGGKHRYWLIWVTGLASQDGGYGAVISGVAVHGAG